MTAPPVSIFTEYLLSIPVPITMIAPIAGFAHGLVQLEKSGS